MKRILLNCWSDSWIDTVPFFYCEKKKTPKGLGDPLKSFGNPQKAWEIQVFSYINVVRSYLMYRSNKTVWNY